MMSSTRNAPAGTDVVFYDGTCGFCHRAVQFLLKRDPAGDRFRYAPLHGRTFDQMLGGDATSLPDSLVVRTAEGRVLVKGRAVRYLGWRLGGFWRLLTAVSYTLPTPVLDWLYDRFAARRHRWFSRPESACPVLPIELRQRFLD